MAGPAAWFGGGSTRGIEWVLSGGARSRWLPVWPGGGRFDVAGGDCGEAAVAGAARDWNVFGSDGAGQRNAGFDPGRWGYRGSARRGAHRRGDGGDGRRGGGWC